MLCSRARREGDRKDSVLIDRFDAAPSFPLSHFPFLISHFSFLVSLVSRHRCHLRRGGDETVEGERSTLSYALFTVTHRVLAVCREKSLVLHLKRHAIQRFRQEGGFREYHCNRDPCERRVTYQCAGTSSKPSCKLTDEYSGVGYAFRLLDRHSVEGDVQSVVDIS